MLLNKSAYKRLIAIQATVESGDISGYAADEVVLEIDQALINDPTEATQRDFMFQWQVRTDVGVEKTGFKAAYAKTGTYAGKLRIIESTGTFAAGDIVTVMGSLTTFDA